jgi:muramoyltetrapeptide carboxypeptidase
MGTPYMPDLAKALLVLEEVDEAPHRVDRMFAQLQNAGVLKKISGIILGKFTDCVPSDPSKPHLTVEQVLQDVSQRVKCPVISNFQYGHIPRKLTVPLGLRARMDSAKGLIEVQEAGVR